MRVSIEHKQKTYGKHGINQLYIIDLLVQFSETEKAIVRARGLHTNIIDISPGILGWVITDTDPSDTKFIGVIFMVIGFFVPLFYRGYDFLFLLVPLGGYFLFKSSTAQSKLEDAQTHTTIHVHTLLENKPISVATFNPVQAKEVDDRIRQQLTKLKAFIDQSETLKKKDTFEL